MDTGWKSYPNDEGRLVIDKLIRSKRKTVQISVSREGKLIVRAPLRLPMKHILRFVSDKREWIEKNRSLAYERMSKTPSRNFQNGEVIYYLGTPYQLIRSQRETRIAFQDDKFIFPESFMDDPHNHLKHWYIEKAREYIKQRLNAYADMTGIRFRSLRITSARRRWGSCSSKDSLNFTWRLIQAQPKAIDYVIVHELCHVVFKNHSRAFWNLVEQIMPEYLEQRKWLKDNQYLLDI